jgi:hypothetical protein
MPDSSSKPSWIEAKRTIENPSTDRSDEKFHREKRVTNSGKHHLNSNKRPREDYPKIPQNYYCLYGYTYKRPEGDCL